MAHTFKHMKDTLHENTYAPNLHSWYRPDDIMAPEVVTGLL